MYDAIDANSCKGRQIGGGTRCKYRLSRCSNTRNLWVDEIMIVIRLEAGDGTGLSFAEEAIDRPPHTSSVSTSFVDFTLPVCCCHGMNKFATALQSASPSCSRVSCIVNGHQLMSICYADDTQVYFHMKVGKILVIKGMAEDCISHVHRWLARNRLRLNPNKTEVMWCSSARWAGIFDQPSLTNGHSTISLSNVVRDLKVQLRANISVADQVSKVVRSCCYNIRQLQTIRSSLTLDALRDAAYALILSRLDYCNALYLNAPVWVTQTPNVDKHCSSCGLWTLQIRSHHRFCEGCAALAANHIKGTF